VKNAELPVNQLPFSGGLASGAWIYLRRLGILLAASLGGLALVGLLAAILLSPLSVVAAASTIVLGLLLLRLMSEGVSFQALLSLKWNALNDWLYTSTGGDNSRLRDSGPGEPWKSGLEGGHEDARYAHEVLTFMLRQQNEHDALGQAMLANSRSQQETVHSEMSTLGAEFRAALERQTDVMASVTNLVAMHVSRMEQTISEVMSSMQHQQDGLIRDFRALATEFRETLDRQTEAISKLAIAADETSTLRSGSVDPTTQLALKVTTYSHEASTDPEQNLIVGIVGSGGAGKTFLAESLIRSGQAKVKHWAGEGDTGGELFVPGQGYVFIHDVPSSGIEFGGKAVSGVDIGTVGKKIVVEPIIVKFFGEEQAEGGKTRK
jgi:hypothetical protein